jgi:hypothetical protein
MIYKLNYTNKETAIKDFLNKGVYIEVENIDKEKQLVYGNGIQAIVEIGKIVLTNGVYDADFNEVTAPVYANGYAYDVMTDVEYKFESEIFPNNPVHNFAGCEQIKDIPMDIIFE